MHRWGGENVQFPGWQTSCWTSITKERLFSNITAWENVQWKAFTLRSFQPISSSAFSPAVISDLQLFSLCSFMSALAPFIDCPSAFCRRPSCVSQGKALVMSCHDRAGKRDLSFSLSSHAVQRLLLESPVRVPLWGVRLPPHGHRAHASAHRWHLHTVNSLTAEPELSSIKKRYSLLGQWEHLWSAFYEQSERLEVKSIRFLKHLWWSLLRLCNF